MDKKYCPYCMNPVKEGEACNNCGLTEGVYTPRDHHLPLGTILNNRYLVGRVLGEGGFGITYIGCDLNLEMKVAIKEYFPIDWVYRFSKTSLQVSNYAHAAEKYHTGKAKFLREARTMARLVKQQNIVSVRDFFEENNTAYIVMEYVDGITLKELVNQRGGQIPAGELLDMLEPLFSALASIHELGLIHRDISPDNLMLENGKIKLLDFGCARESAAQSETMTIALKQGYAPIEQYQHKGQGPWTDIYALSATIYYCLTGKTPQSAVDRLSGEELIPPGRLGVDLSVGQEAALLHGMNVKAQDRFQSVEELCAELYRNGVLTSVSDESGSVQDPDLNQNVRNNEKDEEVKAPAKDNTKKAFDILKQRLSLMMKQKRNLLMLAGCAVLLVTVVCIICAVFLPRSPKETIASGEGNSETDYSGKDDSDEGAVSAGEPQQGNQPSFGTSVDTSQGLETAEDLFANAAVLEAYTKEDIQKLIEDDIGKNTIFQNAVSVSDEASLQKALDEGLAVIICDDVMIKVELHIQTPIMIAEGVTVVMQEFGSIIGDGNDFLLWNEGMIQGGLIRTNGFEMRIINCGEISDGSLVMNGSLVNLGDITVDNILTDSVWINDGHSRIYNIGNLRFQVETNVVFNTNLINYGSVAVSAISTQDASFSFMSRLDNYGEIRVEDGLVNLQSYLSNLSNGRILVCDNATLNNRGVIEIYSGELQCESKGNLMNEEGAVYYLYGTPAHTLESGWLHLTNADIDPEVCEVTNIDELADALLNPGVDKVYLTGEVSCNNTVVLTLTKEVEIAENAQLLMGKGSELVLDGCFLQNDGYLRVDHLTLTHGGSLRNNGSVESYPTAESVIRLGNVLEEKRYNGTDCLMNYGYIHSCKIEIYDSALLIHRGYLVDLIMLQIWDHAYFANVGEIQWREGCPIEISGEGKFHNLFLQKWFQKLTIHIAEGGVFSNYGGLVIQNGDISVDQGGRFESLLGDITFGNDLSVLNYGHFLFCQGGDSSLLQGYFENHGLLQIVGPSGFVIDAPSNAVNPACLNNQGEVRIGGVEGYVRSDNGEFIGSAAHYSP